ncbi:MAG: hypothetical protein LBC77_02965 [Spirochaetaceae bacterium]|nr:hypothetical protein [Spirochaetaceae bacterium]
MKRFAIICAALLFASCFGMSSDITIKKNGSGSIALAYRISEELIALGTLDGNEHLPAVPVGEEDFKRTVSRIEGLSLKSFSSKQDGTDIVYHVNLAFENIDALVSFLDTQGQFVTMTEKDGKRILTVVFAPGTEEYTPEMLELMPVIFDGYDFDFSIKLPSKSDVVFFDRGSEKLAAPAVGVAEKLSQGVKYSAPMGALFAAGETVALEISW